MVSPKTIYAQRTKMSTVDPYTYHCSHMHTHVCTLRDRGQREKKERGIIIKEKEAFNLRGRLVGVV